MIKKIKNWYKNYKEDIYNIDKDNMWIFCIAGFFVSIVLWALISITIEPTADKINLSLFFSIFFITYTIIVISLLFKEYKIDIAKKLSFLFILFEIILASVIRFGFNFKQYNFINFWIYVILITEILFLFDSEKVEKSANRLFFTIKKKLIKLGISLLLITSICGMFINFINAILLIKTVLIYGISIVGILYLYFYINSLKYRRK